MDAENDRDVGRAAGAFLVVQAAIAAAGIQMFVMRQSRPGASPFGPEGYTWERGLIAAAVVLTAIGLVLLQDYLAPTKGRILARIGASTYFFAGVVLVAAETLALTLRNGDLRPIVNTYIVLAFLSQACIGGALAQSCSVAPWIGWATIVWNLGWLIVLPILTPQDIYYPALHHLLPFAIGIGVLWRTRAIVAAAA